LNSAISENTKAGHQRSLEVCLAHVKRWAGSNEDEPSSVAFAFAFATTACDCGTCTAADDDAMSQLLLLLLDALAVVMVVDETRRRRWINFESIRRDDGNDKVEVPTKVKVFSYAECRVKVAFGVASHKVQVLNPTCK
jgi:hypothetical protein